MNQKHIFFLLAFLLVIFIILVSPFALSPELYTIENGSHTPYHTNPEALRRISQEKTDDLLVLMQDVLRSSGTVVLNIRFKDFEEAQEELLEYAERAQHFDNVVVQLDMTESEIEEFRRLNSKNLASMRELLNDTIRFEELNRLEIRYRAEDDPSLLYSVAYEGETLREKIRENFFSYRSGAPSLIESSTKFGLNTTEYEESVEIFEEIVAEIDSDQTTRNQEKPLPDFGEYSLDIGIRPDRGFYGDILTLNGTLVGPQPAGKGVNLFIDSQEWIRASADVSGAFTRELSIKKMRIGVHFIHAVMDSTYSEILPFLVVQSDTTLSLLPPPVIDGGNITCSGTLNAGTHPVSGAQVILYAREIVPGTDEGYLPLSGAYRKQKTLTSATGEYSCDLTLDAGIYLLQAYFPGDGFPLNESKSPIRTVEVAEGQSGFVPLLIGAGCIGICSLGALLYLRRAKKNPLLQPKEYSEEFWPSQEEDQTERESRISTQPSAEEIVSEYSVLAEQGHWANAVHILYTGLRDRIASRYRVMNARVFTPRELMTSLGGVSFARDLESFIQHHEKIHYGGLIPDSAESLRLLTCWTSIWEMMESDGH